MVFEQFNLPENQFYKFVYIAQKEIIQKLNLKLQPGVPNYPGYFFIKKNSNRYFRKHLGFTISRNKKSPLRLGTIFVHDYKKLMLFRLKCGI